MTDATRVEATSCCADGDYAAITDWPFDVSRVLYQRLDQLGFEGRSVLEIGCGYGRLLVGSLLAGATTATGVELDPEALERARERADEAGVSDRCALLPGDGADLNLVAHDLVVLDRVICCYADGDRLVERSAAAALHGYAVSVPESRGLRGAWNRLTYPIGNMLDRLRGEDRVYLHDVRAIERRLVAAGFRLHSGEWLGKWYLGVFVRDQSPDRAA
ncbi:MAG TPA: methyltransferase domain-containing protein [Candidatus Limnocylindria bacterium]|nr:methyltransferase domain-containing protein [Candidatus Limnocylindria bacterium]